MTATTAMPLAVLTGFALSLGTSTFLYWLGTAAMMSTNLGLVSRPYLEDSLVLVLFRLTSLPSLSATRSSWVKILSKEPVTMVLC